MKVYIQHIKKLLDAYEGVIREKSIALDAYLRKKGLKSMTPVSTLKKWNRANETQNMQKKGNTKDQSNNQQHRKKNNGGINENKNCFFEKINNIDKLVARMDQKKRKCKITSIRNDTGNERGNITTDSTVI